MENRPGASGNIGTQAVAQAEPDGYTLLLGFDGTMVINPHVFAEDAVRHAARLRAGDQARRRDADPGRASVAPANERCTELIERAKTQALLLRHLGHRRHAASRRRAPQAAHRRAARACALQGRRPGDHRRRRRADPARLHRHRHARSSTCAPGGWSRLGVPSAKRSSALPDVPTFQESGLAASTSRRGSASSRRRRRRRRSSSGCSKELAAVLRRRSCKERYAVLGIEPVGNTPREFIEQVRADLARWARWSRPRTSRSNKDGRQRAARCCIAWTPSGGSTPCNCAEAQPAEALRLRATSEREQCLRSRAHAGQRLRASRSDACRRCARIRSAASGCHVGPWRSSTLSGAAQRARVRP